MELLLPLLREESARVERERSIAPETVRRLAEAGLLATMDLGSSAAEHGLGDFFDQVRTLASACVSTAWLVSIQGAAQWHAGFFDSQAREEIRSGPDAFISTAYSPLGRLEPTADGYRLSGTWRWATGAEHATWFLLGCLVISRSGDAVDYAVALVSRDDVTLTRSWNVAGLRGVSGREVVIDSIAIPAYRVFGMAGRQRSDGRRLEERALRVPYWLVTGLAHAMPMIGAAEGAYDYHLQRLTSRHRLSMAGTPEEGTDTFSHHAIARGLSEIDAGLLQLRRDIQELEATAHRGESPGAELRLRARRNQVRAAERAIEAIELLLKAAGGHSVREDSPLQRYNRDARTAAAFLTNAPERILVRYGRWAAGFGIDESLTYE